MGIHTLGRARGRVFRVADPIFEIPVQGRGGGTIIEKYWHGRVVKKDGV